MTYVKGKIGIGITTHNRREVFSKTFSNIGAYLPDGWKEKFKLVVVDDASEIPILNVDYRFETNVGIAVAKNKCFELLDDCEHIFLFDDDVYPIVEKWWELYINAGEKHLMYIFKDFATPRKLNDTIVLHESGNLVAYSHARGVMCYFHHDCLDTVGGMDPIFGRWGFEHPDLSNRIYNAGLTSYRYMDVKDSNKLFYCADEHETVKSTVWDAERLKYIDRNKAIYNTRLNSKIFVPYKSSQVPAGKRNEVITTYFTKTIDPQRGEAWKWDGTQLHPLLDSVFKHDCAPLTLINDTHIYSLNTVKSVHFEGSHNPYFQRWLSIREYLRRNRSELNFVFCTDATDVVMLQNPFPHMVAGKLYTGDEPTTVNCPWMLNHHKHVTLQQFMRQYGHLKLLNAGLLGGHVDTVIEFLTGIVDFYFQAMIDSHYHKRPDCGMTDMAVFNYIARTKFTDRIIHGAPVNTVFKANDIENKVCWFKHK